MTDPMRASSLTDAVQDYAIREGLGHLPSPLAVPNLSVMYSQAPTVMANTLYEPVFCMVLRGEKLADFNGRPLRFAEGQGLIVSLDLPAMSWVTKASAARPYLALATRLDRVLLGELSRGMPLIEDEVAESVLSSAPISPPLYDVMARMFALLDAPEDIAVLHPLLMRELHYLLLKAPQGAMLRRIGQAGSTAERIAEVVAHLRAHLDQPMRVEALARIAGMSATVFHQSFKAMTGTTPVQFLKRLRLLEAQRQLRGGEASVTQAAFGVGYESPSQFSRDYSRMFGTSPRSDRMGIAAE
ncbi:AraC family transcriptional regulator [Pseudooceanicola sediminis]|uniref:AraC family transcriptional regulator n=1 Tax=Pseudooceanicola sediminis TaxID=2211117 RepID=A0A399J4N5_9RHOB|nr:AraC family transcriptional regulator [Pseudooceanicola sediminis]RII40210.1 AraC family transcriptional regulator [Pseudooceanicola sediminis]